MARPIPTPDTPDAPDTAAAPTPSPTRCEPVLGADGSPLDVPPPCGGRWLRDPDGGLSPADESTARAAGLAWPDRAAD